MVDPVFSLVGILGLACLLVAVGGGVALAVVLLTQRRREVPVGRARPRRDDSDVGVARPVRTVRPAPSTAPRFCPECNTALPPDAPEGLCPRCLLRGVISSAHDAVKAAPAQQTAAYAGSSTAPTAEELAPLFPQLEIIGLLGQGGMGAVYKARQPSLDRLVAVKVLPQEAGRDPAFAERFNREARALARLSHPNVVAVHDVGKTGDFYYFVMEYVDGVNLRQVLRDGQLRPEQALQIVPQICDALQYAHEEGVVHRDVKPENILLDRKGRVKIADFGLAKLLGRDAGDFTLTGSRQVMGTLYYMAPEQVERPLEVDHRADVYSLGVVFYELLTGHLPVGRFRMPSEEAGTDAYLDEIVLRALEREPAKRYQWASEVKTDVQRGAGGVRPTQPPRLTDAPASARVRAPAIALLVAGILSAVPVPVVLWLVLFGHSPPSLAGLAVMGLPVGLLIVVGALNMLRLRSHGWALCGAVLALLPCGPWWLVSLPVGIWALAVLTAPEVKAAFGRSDRET
jgi:predicted Ser/Thr protein kinase